MKLRLLLAAALLGLAAPVLASPPVLRVCSHVLPPHSYPDARQRPSGFASEVLLQVGTRLGWRMQFQYLPLSRMLHMAETGQCDLVYTLLKNPANLKTMRFPRTALHERHNVLVVRRGHPLQFSGQLEPVLRRYSVGVYRDKWVSEEFERLRRQPWAHIEQTPDAALNLRMLLAGRFDVAIENNITAVYELRKLGGVQQVELIDPPLNSTPAYVAFALKGRGLPYLEAFDAELARYRQTPDYRALEQRYLQP